MVTLVAWKRTFRTTSRSNIVGVMKHKMCNQSDGAMSVLEHESKSARVIMGISEFFSLRTRDAR